MARPTSIREHRLPTVAAMSYRHFIGRPLVYPRRDLSFAANFLHMCFSSPLDQGAFVPPPKVFVDAVDLFLLLHADHEQNVIAQCRPHPPMLEVGERITAGFDQHSPISGLV